jgi:hypothetical protein
LTVTLGDGDGNHREPGAGTESAKKERVRIQIRNLPTLCAFPGIFVLAVVTRR